MISLRTLLFSLTLLELGILYASAFRCPGPDWYYRKGTQKCYFIMATYSTSSNAGFGGGLAGTKSYNDAITTCKVRGGKLLVIDDSEELTWITGKLNGDTVWFWIALTYQNNKWEWQDGETFKPFTTIPGLQVDSLSGLSLPTENRGIIRHASNSTYQGFVFQRQSYTISNGYVCKGDWSVRPWCKIEEGYVYHDGHCFKAFAEPAGFIGAEAQCFAEGGYLPVPKTAAMNSRLQYWFRTYFKAKQTWLGIQIWNKTSSVTVDNVSWMDGTAMRNTSASLWPSSYNLDAYVSNLTDGQNYCGQLTTYNSYYGGMWNSEHFPAKDEWSLTANCSDPRPFVCETPLNKCPFGWHQFGDMCYQINLGDESLQSWTNAQATCRQKDAELVTIYDIYKSIFIADLLWKYGVHDWEDGTGHEYYWIGLKASDNGFAWPDGNPANYTNWYNQVVPANNLNMCTYITFDRRINETGTWKLNPCTQRQGFICEAHHTAAIQPDDVIISAHTCEPPFVSFHEGCFLSIAEEKTYDEAAQDCISRKSRLAVIRTRGENAWVSGQTVKDSWIGLRVAGSTSSSSSAAVSNFQYSYSTGDIAGAGFYQDFADTYMLSVTDNFDRFCVAIAGVGSTFQYGSFSGSTPGRGEWYHANCDLKRAYVCWHEGTPMENLPEVEDISDPQCGAGWFRNGPDCYRVVPSVATWRAAKTSCQFMSDNADLLWITTKEEDTFIKRQLQQYYSHLPHSLWINLYTESANNWHAPYRRYVNTNYLPFAVSNWADGQPTPSAGGSFTTSAHCARITSISTGKWNASRCSQFHGYICKKTIDSLVTPAPTTALPSLAPDQQRGCPQYWNSINGRCVRNNINSVDWASARQACRNDQGYLADFKDESEFIFFKGFSVGSWIGLNSVADPSNPRVFSWTSGAPVTFTPWDVQSPNSHGAGASVNDTNCAAVSPGGITVYPCHERKSYICEREMVPVTGSGQIEIPHSRGCSRWGVGFHENCYYFGQDPSSQQIGSKPQLDFDSARAFCKQHFGASTDLVVLDDGSDEKEFINTHMALAGEEYWLGLKEDSNPWIAFKTWVDGSTVSTTNWAYGQPSVTSEGFKGCVAMHGSIAEHGTIMPGDWYVTSCTERKVALCKGESTFHPSHPTKNPSTPSPDGCPSSWATNPEIDTCFKAYRGDLGSSSEVRKMPWQEAENFCKRFKGGHLASINSEAEQSVVFRVAYGNLLWIGLRQNTNAQNRWEWSDGKALTIANWHSELDYTSTYSPNCVAFQSRGGGWIPQSCHLGNGWVCEVPKDVYYPGETISDFPTAIPVNHTCGASTTDGEWFFDAGSQECVYISKKTDSWDNAQATCESFGRNTNLITVTTTNHPFLMLKIAQSMDTYASAQEFWIGLRLIDFVNKEYGWTDGHTSFFRPWDANEPNGRGTERCVTQHSASGNWRDHNCARSLYYICAKTNRVRPDPSSEPDLSVGNCHSGWIEHGHSCYYFSKNDSKTWEQAHQACLQLLPGSSELVSIHSSVENDFVLTRLKGEHQGEHWIGLHEVATNSPSTYPYIFVWSDQSPVRYSNWHISEPLQMYGKRERAIEMRSDLNRAGRWQVLSATETRNYICKARKDPNALAQPPTPFNCRSGYTQLGENGPCFSVIPLPTGNDKWQNAKDACAAGDGYGKLATAVDVYDNAMFRVLLHQAYRVNNHSGHAWIGMQSHVHNFAWYNACPVTYSNFMTLLPAGNNSDHCISMNRDGKWVIQNCTDSAHYAVCEHRTVPCPAVFNATDNNMYCPVDFPQECSTRCYRVQTQSHQNNESRHLNTFQRAKDKCEITFGGRLASIRNEEEQKCLENYLKHAAVGSWIGLYEKLDQPSGQYVWQWEDEGAGYSYMNWQDGKPTNNSGLNHSAKRCAELFPNGTWNNLDCEGFDNRGLICETDKVRSEIGCLTTARPVGVTDAPKDGLSGGAIAGIVIGVLLAVAVVGAVGYFIVTGKSGAVMGCIRDAGSKVKTAATGVGNRSYAQHANDKSPVVNDHEDYVAGHSYS